MEKFSRRFCQEHRGNGRGSGLEPDRDEDHLLIGLLCDLHGLMDPLHDPDIPAAGLKRALRSRDMEEIAVGCDDAVFCGKVERCIDLPLGGDADRTSRAHHDLQLVREAGCEVLSGQWLPHASRRYA